MELIENLGGSNKQTPPDFLVGWLLQLEAPIDLFAPPTRVTHHSRPILLWALPVYRQLRRRLQKLRYGHGSKARTPSEHPNPH